MQFNQNYEKEMFAKPGSSIFYCIDKNIWKKQAIEYYSEFTTPWQGLFELNNDYRCTGPVQLF